MLTRAAAFLAMALLPSLAAAPAAAQHENDLHFGISNGRLEVRQPPNFEAPKVMYFTGSAYIRDQGADFYVPQGSSNYQLASMTWQQISITPGLVGGSRFGGANPGFLSLASSGPHLHLPFVAAAPGEYYFTFRLTDGVDQSGNPVPDSDPFTMIWVAGSNYLRVDLPLLRNLPDTPFGGISEGFAGVDIGGLAVSSGPAFWNGFYAQAEDRTGGVFVQSGEPVSTGDRVRVRGTLSTSGSERVIIAHSVESEPGEAPAPVATALRGIGGGRMGKHTPGTSGGAGISSTGLLVRVAGAIRYSAYGDAYIDDGSPAPSDGSGVRGVRIDRGYLPVPLSLPSEGAFVRLTGISGAEVNDEGEILPVIRPRGQEDVVSM